MADVGKGPTERVRALVGPDVLSLLENELSQGDLTTLLMSVAAARAAGSTPARLVTALTASRFTRPASADPRALVALEHRLWDLLPHDVEGVELSPVAPLGSTAMAGVNQNRVVSTMRGLEVVSDATNVLALEAARRRKNDQTAVVHLAAGHRLLRAQQFAQGASAHFRLFSMVSSTRDGGSGRTHAQLLSSHLTYWASVLDTVLPSGTRWHVDYTVFRHGAAAERLHDAVIPALTAQGVSLRPLPDRSGASYYGDLAFKIHVETASGLVELGDGGFTDWTAQVMSDAKELCLISCASTERLLSLGGP